MKHFLFVFIGGLMLYVIWQLTSPLQRKNATKTMAKHGRRITAFVFILLGLLVIAYYTPALHLL